MEKIKSVMIAGLGALGTLYADAIERTEGRDLYVLADEERKERYERHPRVFRGEKREFEYVLPTETGMDIDLIMLCTKSGGMREAIDMIGNFVGEETIIISLMNGVCCEDMLAERYGRDHVLYCIYLGDGVKNLNGEVNDVGKNCLFFGSLGQPRDEEQTALLAELCESAGISYRIPDDMLYAYWRKYMLIDAYNQTCAVFGTDYSLFRDVPESMEIVRGLIRECVPLAKAAGVERADELPADLETVAEKVDPSCMPSITQDRLMKRRMEVDIFADEAVKRAAELGTEAPYNEVIGRILHVMNTINGFDS